MNVAVLGPGGVGGLLAGALERAGNEVTVVAREETAALISQRGIEIDSVRFGTLTAHPRALARLDERADALLVATKAGSLRAALDRVARPPALVLPLLNGLEHIALLRERFDAQTVLAGSIRVEADRPRPGVVVHTSPFLLVNMASRYATVHPAMQALVRVLCDADVPARVLDSEAEVMWSKLVRLNALACTTSARDKLLGEIRTTPALRSELRAAMEEASAVARAEGAEGVNADEALAELDAAHATLGSSMQRDIAAGRTPELDEIPGSVLRAAARHGLRCPTIEALVWMITARAGVPAPRI